MYNDQVPTEIFQRISQVPLFKWLVAANAVWLTLWVTGVSGFMIVVGVCSISNLLLRWYDGPERIVVVPVSILLSFFAFQLFLNYGLPLLNFMNIVPHGSIETLSSYSPTPFDYTYRFNELTRLPTLLMLGCLPVLAFILTIKKNRKESWESKTKGALFWPAMVSLLPLLFMAYLRNRGVLDAAILSMSGDGRNHFTITQDIRLEGKVSLGMRDWGSPRLANGLAALISAGNGSRGTLQVGDIFGMSVVYLISVVTICISSVGLVLSQINENTRNISRRILMWGTCVAIPVIVCSTSSLGSVLADGFLSLALGSAVVSIILVISLSSWVSPRISYLVFQLIGLYVLAAAYSFLLPPAICLCFLSFLRFFWFMYGSKGFLSLLFGSVFVGSIGWKFTSANNLSNFNRTTKLVGGAVRDFDFRIVWLVVVALLIWQLISFKDRRFVIAPFVVTGIGIAVTVFLIERNADFERNNFTYYSNKIMLAYMWAISPILILVVVVSIDHLLENKGQWNLTKVFSIGRLLIAVILLVLGFQTLNRKSIGENPVVLASNGWSQPNVESVRPVIERWKSSSGYFVVWNLADNPPKVVYPSVWEDRLANFWSPAMWNGYRGEGFSTLWHWIYFEVNNYDAVQLCPALNAMPITVLTRDKTLESDVSLKCGKTLAKYEVLARPNTG